LNLDSVDEDATSLTEISSNSLTAQGAVHIRKNSKLLQVTIRMIDQSLTGY